MKNICKSCKKEIHPRCNHCSNECYYQWLLDEQHRINVLVEEMELYLTKQRALARGLSPKQD